MHLTPVDFQKAEAALQSGYRGAASQYRRDDDIEVQTPNHRHIAGVLGEICASFGRPISVLDLGCGTGRYFYCLKNVDRLVGIDLSPEMLIAAESPVNSEKISIHTIELIQGNAHFSSFEPHSFDFIYSLGMFGYGCPVTSELCDKFYNWLAPGGQLYFNVISAMGLSWPARLKKEAGKLINPLLSACFQNSFVEREYHVPSFPLTQKELENIMRASRFSEFDVATHICDSPLWQGSHVECRAQVSAPGNGAKNGLVPTPASSKAARDLESF